MLEKKLWQEEKKEVDARKDEERLRMLKKDQETRNEKMKAIERTQELFEGWKRLKKNGKYDGWQRLKEQERTRNDEIQWDGKGTKSDWRKQFAVMKMNVMSKKNKITGKIQVKIDQKEADEQWFLRKDFQDTRLKIGSDDTMELRSISNGEHLMEMQGQRWWNYWKARNRQNQDGTEGFFKTQDSRSNGMMQLSWD